MSRRRPLPTLLAGVLVAAAALLAGPARAATHEGVAGPLTLSPVAAWDAPFIGEVSAAHTVTVTAMSDLAISAVAVAGAAEPSFVVLSDTCTGAVLAADDTCAVAVAAAPRALTPATVTEDLVVTTTAPDASTSTPLTLTNPRLSVKGQYHAQVGRVMDTRKGFGVRLGAVGARSTVTLKVAGTRGGVPASGVSAVVLNLTVTGGTSGGYVTAYPAGQPRPTASSINFTKGWTGANLVTVPLGTNGSVSFYNNSGSVQLVADLVGYYVGTTTFAEGGGADYFSITPYRMFDSRTDWGFGLQGGYYVALDLGFGAELDARVRAFAVTVTVTRATGSGYLAVLPSEPAGSLTTSTLNYTKGDTIANMSVARTELASDGGTMMPTFYIANAASPASSAHVIVDVVGVYATSQDGDYGDRFRPVSPTRIVDTRTDLGLQSVGARVNRTVSAPLSVAGRDTWSLVGNLTGVLPTSPTYLKLWDAGPAPVSSALNIGANQVRANSAWVGLSMGNTFQVRNYTGSLDLVYDVSGSFELFPGTIDTLSGVPWPPLAGAGLRDGSSPRVALGSPVPQRPGVPSAHPIG